jgi:hypothetical protein
MIEGAHVPQGQLSSTSDKGIWLIQVQALPRKRERERERERDSLYDMLHQSVTILLAT